MSRIELFQWHMYPMADSTSHSLPNSVLLQFCILPIETVKYKGENTKIVNKNVKKKRSAPCKCTFHSHKINDLVVIYTTLCYNQECASFDNCVTWYINCYYLKEANKSDYNKESKIWEWPLYQLLRDNNCNNDDEEIHNFK